jgi:hypothetical protein
MTNQKQLTKDLGRAIIKLIYAMPPDEMITHLQEIKVTNPDKKETINNLLEFLQDMSQMHNDLATIAIEIYKRNKN